MAEHILALPAWVALVLVFALPALESSAFVGFLFPGEITLILGGVLAYEGRVSLLAVLVAGALGAVAGDSIGYLVGRRYGRRILEGTLGRLINHRHFDKAEAYLVDRGGKAVFFGRFSAALRVMIPGLAGMSRMPYRTFALYNVAGGVGWVALSVMLGYAGGSSWRHVEHLASRIGLAALVLVLAGLIGGAVIRRSRREDWVRRQGAWLRRSRPAIWTIRRFPRTVAWGTRRVDPSSRAGLRLAVPLSVVIGATWIFLGTTQDVVADEELVRIDRPAHLWVLAHRTPWLDTVMAAVTWLGSSAVLVPVLVVSGLLLRRSRGSWRPAVLLGSVYVTAVLLHALAANLVHRPRPPVAGWIVGAAGWSYPSGHTVQATAAYGVLLVLCSEGATRNVRRALGLAAVLAVGAVASSRVYLGVHWASDVIGAASLGIALVALSSLVRVGRPAEPVRPVQATSSTAPAGSMRAPAGPS